MLLHGHNEPSSNGNARWNDTYFLLELVGHQFICLDLLAYNFLKLECKLLFDGALICTVDRPSPAHQFLVTIMSPDMRSLSLHMNTHDSPCGCSQFGYISRTVTGTLTIN